jgi:ankyrin repeat protein
MKTRSIQSLIRSLQIVFLILVTNACGQTDEKAETKSIERPSELSQNVEKPKEDIHMAIISGHYEIVKQHIEAGTNLDQKEQMSGSTPLHTAITFNKPKMVQLLIDAGTDLSIKNNEGSTPLHNAAFFCRIDMVKMLLEAGADKTIKNNYGMTSRDLVLAEFKVMKPVYDMVSLQLKPMGFTLDIEEVQKARPVVAMMLE